MIVLDVAYVKSFMIVVSVAYDFINLAGEHVFLECSTPSIVSNQFVSCGTAKTCKPFGERTERITYLPHPFVLFYLVRMPSFVILVV